MLNFIIIASEFGALERTLLRKNISRIKACGVSYRVVYVVNRLNEQPPAFDSDSITLLMAHARPKRSQSAATNRLSGWRHIIDNYGDEDQTIVFCDGDMLLTRNFASYLASWSVEGCQRPTLLCCPRLDLRSSGPDSRFSPYRQIGPNSDSRGRFTTIYGCFAIRNISSEHMACTQDNEEQWLLVSINGFYGKELASVSPEQIGVLHVDRWSGSSRWRRFLRGSRGVGFWQGLLLTNIAYRYPIQTLLVNKRLFACLIAPALLFAIHPYLLALMGLYPKALRNLVGVLLGLAKLPRYPMPKQFVVTKASLDTPSA